MTLGAQLHLQKWGQLKSYLTRGTVPNGPVCDSHTDLAQVWNAFQKNLLQRNSQTLFLENYFQKQKVIHRTINCLKI